MMPTPSSFGEKTCSADEVKRGLDDFVPSASIDDRLYSSISPEEAAKKFFFPIEFRPWIR
jgi:hypothetical protein